MMNYLCNCSTGTAIYQNQTVKYVNHSNLFFVKQLCMQHLFSFEGYLKAIKQQFKKTYRIPIYFNNRLMLIPTQRYRDYDNIWINYAAIKNYWQTANTLTIEFDNLETVDINIKLKSFKRQIDLLSKIKKYKEEQR